MVFAIFALSALANAFLLFWVEPLFARMILPLLGGSPSVWNTCLMSYQVLLLVGYAYAHLGTRLLTVRRQAFVHIAAAAAAALVLPIVVPTSWILSESGPVAPRLAIGVTVALGAPFVVLSATAPMLQRWMASMEWPALTNPYALYAASNAGSFLGLLAFPVLLEPNLGLVQQSRLWAMSYGCVVLLVFACAIMAVRRSAAQADGIGNSSADSGTAEILPAPQLRDRARWTLLAFVPSSLLLGVTTYLSTDIAAVPFLWVVPLALYLLSFVIAFARRGSIVIRPMALLQAAGAAALVIGWFWRVDLDLQWAFPLHLGVFALTALLLHGQLASAKPAPAFLTEYYLWIALGGALGGVFNSLIAPLVFDSIAEYPLMVVVACLVRPTWKRLSLVSGERLQSMATTLTPALGLAVLAAYGLGTRQIIGVRLAWLVSFTALVLIVRQWRTAVLFGASIAAVSLATLFLYKPWKDSVYKDRSFFGVYRIRQVGELSLMFHGTTIHGAQFTDSARRTIPLTYYHPNGPAGVAFRNLGPSLESAPVGVVGLGTGSLLCYGSPSQNWTFYEIDPAVERIARDRRFFSFLDDCTARASVVLGDARLTLSREQDARFGVLVLDAFSSDAIPAHLLTREAFVLYRRLLLPDGVLLVHISNRHVNLEPVLAAVSRELGFESRIAKHEADPESDAAEQEYSCDWVIMAPQAGSLSALASEAEWTPLETRPSLRTWTDDYYNLVSVLKR